MSDGNCLHWSHLNGFDTKPRGRTKSKVEKKTIYNQYSAEAYLVKWRIIRDDIVPLVGRKQLDAAHPNGNSMTGSEQFEVQVTWRLHFYQNMQMLIINQTTQKVHVILKYYI